MGSEILVEIFVSGWIIGFVSALLVGLIIIAKDKYNV